MPFPAAQRPPGRPLLLTVALAGAVALGACSEADRADTPSACLDGSRAYVRALTEAPGPVTLADETPISDCLVPEQGGGDLAAVGKEMIAAATALNAEARDDPRGPAALRLGYLVGAVERGSEGIHADLVRRLNAAARFNPGGEVLPASFERRFGRGYGAGLESG